MSDKNKKSKSFFAGKGFYMILFACIAVVGVSGYFLFFGGQEAQESPASISVPNASDIFNPADWTVNMGDAWGATEAATAPVQGSTELVLGTTAKPIAPPVTSESPTTRAEATEPTTKAVMAPVDLTYIWPVSGGVVKPYAIETLQYNETLGDWRIHSGVDIETALGEKVMTIAPGTVIEVTEDLLLGTTVKIDHGNGIVSAYGNLLGKPSVKAGDGVKAGEVIGGVGETAMSEVGEGYHLHLEVWKDGKAIDPADILP